MLLLLLLLCACNAINNTPNAKLANAPKPLLFRRSIVVLPACVSLLWPTPPPLAHAQRYTTPANCANKRGNERERESSSRERERLRMPASSTIIRMLHAKLVPQIASISLRVRVVVVARYCCPVRVVFSARFALDCNNLISSLLFEPNQLPT